jgi:hypothetical protein
MSAKLKGALVEVWFRIKHYHLFGDRTDSFSGMIEQIVVLCPPIPKLPSPYRNRETIGPYRPHPTTAQPSHSELKRAADTFFPIPPVVGNSNAHPSQIEATGTEMSKQAAGQTAATADPSPLDDATPPAAKKRRTDAESTNSSATSSTVSDSSNVIQDKEGVKGK